MSSLEQSPHSFILRIWREPQGKDGSGEWRGMLEHVASRQQFYVRDLDHIAELIRPFLEDGEVKRRRWWERAPRRR